MLKTSFNFTHSLYKNYRPRFSFCFTSDKENLPRIKNKEISELWMYFSCLFNHGFSKTLFIVKPNAKQLT